jgi:precorrin-6B methylase 1
MTAPASAEPHIRAVQAVLEAALQHLPTPIHAKIGQRDDAETTVVVIHGDPGLIEPGSLGDLYSDLTIPIQLTAVGEGPEQASAYADAARSALLTAPLAVAGREVWLPRQTGSQPAQRDDTVQPALWIATAQYVIKSTPA